MDDFFKQLKKAPVSRTIMFWKNFDRASPTYWIFIIALAVFIIGIIIETAKLLFWIGLIVILLYLIPVIYFLWMKLK